MEVTNVKFFKSQKIFSRWLKNNHLKKEELWLRFYHLKSGKPTITYKQALDEALRFGWIDGLRKKIGIDSYAIRFTPRKPNSNWSKTNIKRVNEMIKLGLMMEQGLKAFSENKNSSLDYSYEVPKELSKEYTALFKKNKPAWEFFKIQTPYYKRTSSFWVMDAKREETRLKRLTTLIADSENELWITLLRPKQPKKK